MNCFNEGFSLQKANLVYHELLDSPKNYSSSTKYFLENQIPHFIIYSIAACVLGALLGHISQWIVIKTGWDIKFKILRFKNNWSYIFNGKYLEIERFSNFNSKVQIQNNLVNQEIMMTIADIVVIEGGERKMYSGAVVDYDLDFSDSNSLERIYLKNVHRYKFKSEKEISENPDQKRFEKILIPGDLFLLETKNMVNINLTYVPSRKKNKPNFKKNIAGILSPLTFFLILIFSIIIFTGLPKVHFINYLKYELNFIQKLFLSFTLLVVGSIIFYDPIKKAKNQKEFKDAQNGMWFFVVITLVFLMWEFWIYRFFY